MTMKSSNSAARGHAGPIRGDGCLLTNQDLQQLEYHDPYTAKMTRKRKMGAEPRVKGGGHHDEELPQRTME
jgi:hypothetical protein